MLVPCTLCNLVKPGCLKQANETTQEGEIFTMFQDISLKILSNDKLKILFIETGIANIYDRKKES